MQQIIITCPKCKADIELTDTLAGPLLESTKKQAAEDLAAANKRADTIAASIGEAVAREHNATKAAVMAEAKAAAADDLRRAQQAAADAEQQAESLQVKLTAAQRAQAEALKRERELADKERELDLTIEQRVLAASSTIRQQATTQADEANRLKLMERDQLVESMQKKVSELQQKIEQGSQQLQGEAQELDLEQQLRTKFPFDAIGEVAKGVNGADITQKVSSPSGAIAGLILWESKRTKRWSDGWLAKLREDGRKVQADLLVIVSTALPEEVESFNCVDGVWVCSPQAAMPVALALRAILLSVHNVKQTQAGMATTAEEVYIYVTGPQFRHRVEALVEAFTTMQEDLTAEQKVQQRQWAKRAAQIERVLTSTSGMFGDLQGIAGKALPAPAGLSLSNGGGE
jgi:hypothetical protein